MTKEEIKKAAISKGRLVYPYPDDEFDEYIDTFVAGANFVNEKQPYSKEDVLGFLSDTILDYKPMYTKLRTDLVWKWKGNKDYAKEIGIKTSEEILKEWKEKK